MIVVRIVTAEELMIRTPLDLLLLALADGTLRGPAAAGDTVDVNILDWHYIYVVWSIPRKGSWRSTPMGVTEERGSTE
jgi:hypothetical protein